MQCRFCLAQFATVEELQAHNFRVEPYMTARFAPYYPTDIYDLGHATDWYKLVFSRYHDDHDRPTDFSHVMDELLATARRLLEDRNYATHLHVKLICALRSPDDTQRIMYQLESICHTPADAGACDEAFAQIRADFRGKLDAVCERENLPNYTFEAYGSKIIIMKTNIPRRCAAAA